MPNLLNKILNKKEPIKIGHLTPLSGEYAYFGKWESEGIDLAVERINGKGGINGQRIVVAREDDRMDPPLTVAVLNKLIDTEKIQAVIGSPSSDVVLASAPIADKNRIVVMAALAGSVRISTASKFLFRIYPQTAEEGEELVAAASQLNHKRTAIIYINNVYGLELAKSVKRNAAERGIEVLIMEGYRQDSTDFSEQLGRIKEKNPEAIFLLGYPRDMEIILKQAGEFGINAKYFAPDTFEDPIMIKNAGRLAEGVVYVTPEVNLAPEFIKIFQKKNKKEPNIFNAMTYDALNLLALAIQRGGNDGTAIKDELFKIKDYKGASGIITFDENGDAINRPLKLKMIKKGKAIDYPR
jgi:branched-chain amino acid transport system substrate-binding protein